VVQLSVDASKPLDYHVELGAKLATLRERGVLIIGSGNIVHNLRAMNSAMPDNGFDWAQRFDDAARAQLTGDPGGVGALSGHRDFGAAVPTPYTVGLGG